MAQPGKKREVRPQKVKSEQSPAKRRRERLHLSRQTEILDAARSLYAAEGYQGGTMRAIAERIDYTASAIYAYFPSKEAIYAALAVRGFEMLGSRTTVEAEEPLEALRLACWRYYEFACEHPDLFTLMLVDPSVPRLSAEIESSDFMKALAEEGPRRVVACVEAGLLPHGTDPLAASRLLWLAVHGPAVIRLWGRLGPEGGMDALAALALDNAIAGLKAGACADPAQAGQGARSGSQPRSKPPTQPVSRKETKL